MSEDPAKPFTLKIEKKRSIFADIKSGYTAGKEDYIKRQALAIAKKEEAAASLTASTEQQSSNVEQSASPTVSSIDSTSINAVDLAPQEPSSQRSFWWHLKQMPYSLWIGIGLIIKGVIIGKQDYDWVSFGSNGTSLPIEKYIIDSPSTVVGFMSLLIGLTVLLFVELH